MRVTVLGHAGLLIESGDRSIVCDPWFIPAFFGSWFVYPRNDQLSDAVMATVTNPTYLYISHLHSDHLDPPFLTERMNKSTTVLLPGYPTGELERELRGLGFTNFIRTVDGEPLDLDGLTVTICTETAVADGPQGDSLILVEDASGRVLNQNDCRPRDLGALRRDGPIDLQVLQYSGAIWYPHVYDMPEQTMTELIEAKREAQLSRSLQYVRLADAAAVVPSAGPPAFLDDDLYGANEFDDGPHTIFPDQRVFLARLAAAGVTGVMNVPGTVIEIDRPSVAVTHPGSDEQVRWPFDQKREAIDAYRADWALWLEAHKATWHEAKPDMMGRLAQWWEPLLAIAPNLRAGVGANVLIRSGDEDILIDFPAGQVRSWAGDEVRFRFEIPRRLLETVVDRHAVDWSNSLFLSCRFRAWRAGAYNEYVYNFFKSLSPERMARAEAEASAALAPVGDGYAEFRCGDHFVERFCPHRQADLASFAEVDGDVLTCTLHGWRFSLTTGECLTSPDRSLRVRPAST